MKQKTRRKENERIPVHLMNLKAPARLPARLFLVCVSLLIVYLSHQPSLKPPFELFQHQDKLFHIIEFGGLGLALVLNADLFGQRHTRLKMGAAGVIWAVMDEFHQSFIPGRASSFQDIMADSAGLVLAFLVFRRLMKKSD